MTRTTSDGCALVRSAVHEGRLDAPEVRAHAEGCEACAALVAAPELHVLLLAPDDAEVLPEQLAQAIADRVADEPAPARRSVRLLGVSVGLLVAGGLFGLARVRPDLGAVPTDRAALLLGLLALAAWLGVGLVARPPFRPALGPVRRGVALGVLWTLPALAIALPLSAPAGIGPLHVATLACLGYGTVMVVLSVGVLGAVFRRDTLLGARWPLAAATGAVVANVSLVLHCPLSDVGHLLASHVGLGLLAAAVAGLGSVVGPRLTPGGPAR